MFNKQNFCHIASNNRNDVKVGVFVYKTTDDLATVSTSGYFNDKIIDINLHDLIIHEWHDSTDRTKVQRNVLCVTERTLDNVGTQIIKTNWEEQTDETLEQLATDISGKVSKSGDTMTGALEFSDSQGSDVGIKKAGNGSIKIYKTTNEDIEAIYFELVNSNRLDVYPIQNNAMSLGQPANKLKNVYTGKINNGVDLTVPTPAQADTIALKSEVDTAANSGSQLTNKGVWYAKMYAATVVPSGAEYDGCNYADFSQTDINGDPIIVLYEGQNGAWVQTQTITPPTDYNGYVTVTSKIWDIAEQSGQQGGKVLWAHNTKTFTPYPQIISFEDAHLTGDSTVVMPLTPSGTSIVNVDYLSNHTGSGKNVGDVFFTMRNDNALSGAVECNGATYNTEDFVGSGTISGLLTAGKIPYVSLAQYETLLTTNGSVGVFGWDGGNTTAFRVPSLNDIFIETGTAAQIGDYIAPSAPNINATMSNIQVLGPGASGSISVTSTTARDTGTGHSGGALSTFSFNASSSSSVYKDSATTIQPNTVRYRAMVQLATGATDEALETCTQVLADVADLKDHRVIAFQAPTADNNYTWYKKYKDGSVEQGGVIATVSDAALTVNLPVTMADTHYTVSLNRATTDSTALSGLNSRWDAYWGKTTTSFGCWEKWGTTTELSWEVKGVYAQ